MSQDNSSFADTEEIKFSVSGYPLNKLEKDVKQEIAQTLTDFQKYVLFRKGTEKPFVGKTGNGFGYSHKQSGTYVCAASGLPVFHSSHKFESGTGWPSFYAAYDKDHVALKSDYALGIARTEVVCGTSGAHLGHVFNDGPRPTHLRFCINACALNFIPDGEQIEYKYTNNETSNSNSNSSNSDKDTAAKVYTFVSGPPRPESYPMVPGGDSGGRGRSRGSRGSRGSCVIC